MTINDIHLRDMGNGGGLWQRLFAAEYVHILPGPHSDTCDCLTAPVPCPFYQYQNWYVLIEYDVRPIKDFRWKHDAT